jgi:hypothetical protein
MIELRILTTRFAPICRGLRSIAMPLGGIVLGVWVLGCSTTGAPSRSASISHTVPPGGYRLESEGQFPPLDSMSVRGEVDRIDVFEESEFLEDTVAVENVIDETPVAVADSWADSTTTPGYRVQIVATGDGERAEAYKTEVEARLGSAAYLEHIDGVFKVRVGDCRSRREAEELLQRCRAAGYTDAWIVAEPVRSQRIGR